MKKYKTIKAWCVINPQMEVQMDIIGERIQIYKTRDATIIALKDIKEVCGIVPCEIKILNN